MRRTTSSGTIVQRILSTLSEKQKEFVLDSHRFKGMACGRRAGKTHADAAYFLKVMVEKPNAKCLFLGLTKDSAKEAIWDKLIEQAAAAGLEYEPKEATSRFILSNGSSLQIMGADTPRAKNRLRGRAFDLVIVDECGFVGEVDELILVILPAMADFGGTIAMTSSPPEVLKGLFYEAWQGNQKDLWHFYCFTMKDNPFFQQPAVNKKWSYRWEEEFELALITKFGNNENHPAFRREYLGECVADETTLVYPYTDLNDLTLGKVLRAPLYGLGLDFGWEDDNAFVVGKWSEYDREFHFVESYSQNQMLIDDIVNKIEEFRVKYPIGFIIGDTGGYGKSVVEEIKGRYGLHITPAEKTDKGFYQKVFKNDLLAGFIKAQKESGLVKEWKKLVKDPDTNEEKDGQTNHNADAGLYLYRYAYTKWLKNWRPPMSEEEKMENAVIRAISKVKSTSWYEE